jgi:hypothetical protein
LRELKRDQTVQAWGKRLSEQLSYKDKLRANMWQWEPKERGFKQVLKNCKEQGLKESRGEKKQ